MFLDDIQVLPGMIFLKKALAACKKYPKQKLPGQTHEQRSEQCFLQECSNDLQTITLQRLSYMKKL
jgi:hypothetical protein